MNLQDIHDQFKKVLDDLCEIDSSETFIEMLSNNSFLIDDDDMGYLIHQVEVMLCAVKTFGVIDVAVNEEKISIAAAPDPAICAANFGFAPNQD